MSKPNLAGAAALLAAPLAAFAGVALAPTVSDDAADRVAAVADHRGATIAGLSLQTIALVLLIAGAIWLASALASRAPRLALAGGVLAVAGALIPLFEDGVDAAAPSVVASLDPSQATAVLERIGSSPALAALEPFSLLGDVGLALLGAAAVKAAAPRWVGVAVAIGALGEGAGFGSGVRPLILVGFAILFVGFAAVVRALATEPAARVSGEAVTA